MGKSSIMLEVANLDFKNSHQFYLLIKEHDDKAKPDVEPVQVYISKATFYVSDTLIKGEQQNIYCSVYSLICPPCLEDSWA